MRAEIARETADTSESDPSIGSMADEQVDDMNLDIAADTSGSWFRSHPRV
jgi:hypothetical protein